MCLSNEIGYTIIKFVGSRPLVKLCLNVLVIHGGAFSVLGAQIRPGLWLGIVLQKLSLLSGLT